MDYCYFISPNGTEHSVLKGNKVIVPALEYVGQGFELGDCTAEVKVSNETDVGKWTCHMGITSGKEVQNSFNVEFKGIVHFIFLKFTWNMS